MPGTDSSRSAAGGVPGCQPVSRRAIVSRLARRSVSAWALPRPSATASARLANTTVRNSQTTMVQLKMDGLLIAVYRVSTAPTSTTNMTGFLTWTRGSSFLNASGVDFHSIFGSSSPPPGGCGGAGSPPVRGVTGGSPPGEIVVTAISVQSFCERPERERGEVGQADEDEDHADEHADEQRRSRIQRAGALRHRCLPGQRPG